jgi:hypothetical protein
MSTAYQVGCRLSCYHRLLRWFTYPPIGTIFTPADVINNNILLSICAFLNGNWNLWGGEEARNLCRIGDFILNVYQQQEIIDLAVDEDHQMEEQWIILDELHEDDLPNPEDEESVSDAPDMLLNLDDFWESEEEQELDSHSESDYSTSESDDSGFDE